MRLIRLCFRVFSFIFLVMMIVTLVIDAAHSVGASTLIMTPVRSTVSFMLQSSLQDIDTFISQISPLYVSQLAKFVVFCPTWIVFVALSLVCYIIGYDGKMPPRQSTYGEGNV